MYNLAQALSERDVDVHIITNSTRDYPEETYSKGIYLHRLVLSASVRWPYTPDWSAQAANAIAQYIKKFDLQIIDAQDCTALMASFLAKAQLPSIPIIFTLHDAGLNYPTVSHSQMGFFINDVKWGAMIVPSIWTQQQVKLLAKKKLPIFKI